MRPGLPWLKLGTNAEFSLLNVSARDGVSLFLLPPSPKPHLKVQERNQSIETNTEMKGIMGVAERALK